jgi:hypothetical protein
MTSPPPPPPERTYAPARPGPVAPDGPDAPVVPVTPDNRPLGDRAREVLEVPGPPWVRIAVRGVGAVGVLGLVGALRWGGVGLSLMVLVLLGMTLARVTRLRGGLQLLLGITLLVGAWAALLQLYQRWWWLDVVVHVAATGLLAVLAVAGLGRLGLLRVPAPGRPERLAIAAVTVAVGLALGIVWEVGEWVGHTYLDPAIFVSFTDTMGDLAAAALGSAAAGAWLATRRVVQ